MIALLATLPGRVAFPGSSLRLRCRFVDEDTEIDQTPASVALILRNAAGSSTTYTWTAPSTAPTLDARLTAFSKTATASMTVFEATVAITSSDRPGTWTFGWRALDAQGHELVTSWGAIDVEPDAANPTQSAPVAAPPNPADDLGADVWSRGFYWSWYY